MGFARLQIAGTILIAAVIVAVGVETRTSLVAWLAVANAAGLELELLTHGSLAPDFSGALPLRGVRIGIEDSGGAEIGGESLARAGFALEIGSMYNF